MSDPDVLSGATVFAGTRVPVQTLIDYLQEGQNLEQFLDDFPSVSREQAVAALDLALESLTRLAHDPEALLVRVRERKERTGITLSPDPILTHRDADRR